MGVCVYVYVRCQKSAKFSALKFSKLAALLSLVLLFSSIALMVAIFSALGFVTSCGLVKFV
jgi:hypothetical protein